PRSTAEWQATSAARPNVGAELYRHPAEALEHPQLRHDRRVVVVEDPEAGVATQIGPIFTILETPAIVAPAPVLGQDTTAVLDALRTGRRNPGAAPPPAPPP